MWSHYAATSNRQTHGLMNRNALANVKQALHCLKIHRGAMVGPDALLETVDSDHMRRAALGVIDPEPLPNGHPFHRNSNVRATPRARWSNGGAPIDKNAGC